MVFRLSTTKNIVNLFNLKDKKAFFNLRIFIFTRLNKVFWGKKLVLGLKTGFYFRSKNQFLSLKTSF